MIVTALAARTYLRDRERYQREYTKTTRQRDIADSVRTAISALEDAELQAQHYAITGETAYSEEYMKDVRIWQDESGTAAVEALHDPAAPLVRDLSEHGKRVLTELERAISLFDGGSHDAALDSIRKGAAIVYLEQARETLTEILRLDALAADESNQSFINNGLRIQRRLIQAVGGLFGLAVAGFVLLMVGTKRRREVDAGTKTPVKQSAAAVL